MIARVDKLEKLLGWKALRGREDLEKAILRMVQKEASQTHE